MGGGKKNNKNKSSTNRKKKKNKSSNNNKELAASSSSLLHNNNSNGPLNFELNAGPGCHIARRKASSKSTKTSTTSSWVLDWETIDPEDYDLGDEDNDDDNEEIPDIAVDTEEKTLSLCNIDDVYKVAYISVYDTILRGRNGQVLEQGTTIDNNGTKQTCTTLIVLCPPRTFAHLCYIDLPDDNIPSLENLRLDSDVQEWNRHSNPDDTYHHRRRRRTIGFPLEGGPFRCTQCEGGQLTHFFAGNLHAVDFACPVGTPLLAVADGVVVDVKDNNRLTGIAVSNLFEWNSILIKVDPPTGSTNANDGNTTSSVDDSNDDDDDDPLFVEYVHIEKSSVKKGDRVQAGQRIGTSGSIGFSPEPHLHFAAYRSQEPTAETVRVLFHHSSSQDNNEQQQQQQQSSSFLPRSGCWYSTNGKEDPPENDIH